MARVAFVLGLVLGAAVALAAIDARASDASWTASPVAADDASLGDLEREALRRCGRSEAGLAEVAARILAKKVAGGSLPDPEELARLQRSAGEPHPWARVWSARGTFDGPGALAPLEAWLGDGHPERRRCGVAASPGRGDRALVMVTVDAVADLSPLPLRARTGQWLSVDARMRVRPSAARVVVIDPDGGAHDLPSWTDGGGVHARWAAPGPGEATLQVVADLGAGPRPVIEATVWVDVPPSPEAPAVAPGEASLAGKAPVEQLDTLVTAARAAASLAPLRRDPSLDATARAHAQRMAQAQRLAHDAGDGDPGDRLRESALGAVRLGENVAHGPTVALANRALWASPSHRLNLLTPDYDRLGLGVALDAAGAAWIVEVFSASAPPSR